MLLLFFSWFFVFWGARQKKESGTKGEKKASERDFPPKWMRDRRRKAKTRCALMLTYLLSWHFLQSFLCLHHQPHFPHSSCLFTIERAQCRALIVWLPNCTTFNVRFGKVTSFWKACLWFRNESFPLTKQVKNMALKFCTWVSYTSKHLTRHPKP